MVNCPKRNKKPVVCYTNVSKPRINQAQKGIPKIPVTTTHNYSPILALDEDEFTKILGGKIDTAFCSAPNTASYQPGISPSKSGIQDSGMPTSTQLSTIAKKRSRGSRSKATSIAPTDKIKEPAPTLITLLTTLNKNKMSNTPLTVQEDNQGSYINLAAHLYWEKFPILQFCGPVVMWSTLMLDLENLYVISTKRLKEGNNIHWRVPRLKLISCALKLLELVFTAWSDPRSAVGTVPLWHGSDSHKYFLQRAMGTALELLSYNQAGSRQSMALVGNLVLSGSKVVYHKRLHHMPEYIEWLLGVMYSVGGKTPEEYAQQKSLLWECILLGLAFPYLIGVNCVSFLPVNDSPFLPFAFCWLPSVWMTYAAIAKVLIQLRLGLEATVSQ
ncbi:hypothetical protein DSO57_1025649 [Entomophthora muscae]|uniref:Uncharacterized protein n=1 Tax=Entomophthora muscae TaxID=34485 RepID=A0ACC2RTA5_9FUNG|nr:hypothetical protein DSO57_1025649 [Entomophthora muscae]